MGDNIVIDPCTASMVELSWEVLQAVATVNLHSLVLHVKICLVRTVGLPTLSQGRMRPNVPVVISLSQDFYVKNIEAVSTAAA